MSRTERPLPARPGAARFPAAFLWLSFAGLALAETPAVAPSPGREIGRMAWLAGCWHREAPRRVVEEQWMRPAGGVMLGMSRAVTTEEDKLVEFEAVRIEEKDGRLVYTAKPYNQPEGSFHSIQITDELVLFENKEHDFPQRIGYRRVGADSLLAWIEGTVQGKSRKVEYPYRRSACPDGRARSGAPAEAPGAR